MAHTIVATITLDDTAAAPRASIHVDADGRPATESSLSPARLMDVIAALADSDQDALARLTAVVTSTRDALAGRVAAGRETQEQLEQALAAWDAVAPPVESSP